MAARENNSERLLMAEHGSTHLYLSPSAQADLPPYHQRRLSAVMPEVLRHAVNFGSGW